MTELVAAVQDFTIRQGDSWSAIIQLYQDDAQTIPFDATGCEIDITIREGVADSGASALITLSTRDGTLTWLSYASDNTVDEEGAGDPADGVFLWEMTPAQTLLLTPSKRPRKGGFEEASFIYDVSVTDADSGKRTPMEGTITVPLEVTR